MYWSCRHDVTFVTLYTIVLSIRSIPLKKQKFLQNGKPNLPVFSGSRIHMSLLSFRIIIVADHTYRNSPPNDRSIYPRSSHFQRPTTNDVSTSM
jgi:hypothetical protein